MSDLKLVKLEKVVQELGLGWMVMMQVQKSFKDELNLDQAYYSLCLSLV
jgi:hypothetical protein